MKTVTAPMAAHLLEGSTTLTTCWKITRTDGQEFHYTELDEDVTFEGNVYKSAAGFNKSAIQSSATFAVDKLEVTGFLRDDGITDEEIRNGAFDYAAVEVFMVNYMNLSMGKVRLRAGWFGEVRTTGSGAFLVELRGLVDMLQVKIGNTYLPECRVDLGSTKCGIKLVPDERQAGRTYKVGDRIVWPVELAEFIGARHFPDLVDPNYGPRPWGTSRLVNADLNVSPVKGPQFLRLATRSGVDDRMDYPVRFADIGLTPDEVASGLYRITFRYKYFKYTGMSKGYVRIGNQKQYFDTGIYTPLDDVYKGVEALPPKREWVPGEVSIDIHPDSDRFIVSVAAEVIPGGISTICYDDFDFIISYKENQVSSFAQYGGVEFEATVAGKTAQTAPVFTSDDDVVDGEVTWSPRAPKYTFLRALTHDMTLTNSLRIEPAPEAWENFFDWGVLKFLTGPNAGRAMEIQNYNADLGIVKLALPLPYRGVEGDLVSIQAGCNKTTKNCKLFENILNFRGHPRVPGQGQYFKVAGM